MARNSVTITPVTPAIGAEISGLDLSQPLSDEDFKTLNETLAERQVLFFRDQEKMSPEAQVRLGKYFGPLHVHPAAPTLVENPDIFVIHTHKDSAISNGNVWHSDVSCDNEPPMGSILHLHEIPESGGDTMFASMYAAYDSLSEPVKGFIGGLEAWHESAHVHRDRLGQHRRY